MKRFDEAICCCEKALTGTCPASPTLWPGSFTINPRLGEVWVSRGLALGGLRRFEEELSCYERALAINPRYLEAWYRTGLPLRDRGLIKQAERCIQRATASDHAISPKTR